MTKKKLTLTNAVANSYRVARVASMLDVPLLTELVREIEYEEPPSVDDDWKIGLIVGPSGSGKTSIARDAYANALYRPFLWDDSRAIVDNFDARAFDELADALRVCGLATPKRWAQPYSTLSGGERFRCDLAKALLDSKSKVVAFDEFASLVDRTVAKTTAIALRKAFDRGAFDKKFVAISPHSDVAPWLEPDWTLDTATGKLTRGRLRRPALKLRVYRGRKELWRLFKDYHYLSGDLNPISSRFVATLDGLLEDGAPRRETLVAFAAVMQSEGRVGHKRVHRLVVRPEYQGIGIGGAFLDALGALVKERGALLSVVTGARQLAKRLERSDRWRFVRAYPCGKTQRHKGRAQLGSFGRAVVSFEYKNEH